jgi:uncharacterized protein YhaN
VVLATSFPLALEKVPEKMTTVSVPFQDLAHRIQQQEAELAKLRQELESRRGHLAELTRRKEELQAELAKVEKDIEAVGQAGVLKPKVSATHTPATTSGSKATANPFEGMSLPTYLVHLVGKAKSPITVKALTEEVVRNKFPTTSKNVQAMVQTRVQDLVRKGLLRRPGDSPGVVLAQVQSPTKSAATKVAATTPKTGKVKADSAKPTASTTHAEPPKWRSLHEVLTHVLSKSSRPLSAQELKDRVIQSGYESKSKDLKNVIWTGIKKLATVERIPGQGYRLKKGKPADAGRKS